MTAADAHTGEAVTPLLSISRTVSLIRVVVLWAAGLAITFTATMHEQLVFDQNVIAISLAGIGIAHLVQAFAVRGRTGFAISLLLGLVSLAAAVAVPVTASSGSSALSAGSLGAVVTLAVIVASWALVSGLFEFISAVTQPGTRSDAVLLGALGMLLALLTLVFRQDPVAVIGFFGAYAIAAGVFLGISAFDIRRADASEPEAAAVTTATANPQQ